MPQSTGAPGGVVRPLGIDHRDGRRQLVAGQVVVGDHHADARGPRLRRTVSTAVMPQSQVMTSEAPAARAASRPAGPKS